MKDQASFIAWRFYLIIFILLVSIIGLLFRTIDLTIFKQGFLRREGDERALRLTNMPAYRGMILDRNGAPMAVSTVVYSVWFSPKEFIPNKQSIAAISSILNVKIAFIAMIINKYRDSNREFAYLKRGVEPNVANKITALKLPGLYVQPEYKRYYPEAEITAHVIGLTNIDDQGQEGVELAYDSWLKGLPGKKWVIKDRLNRVISDVKTVKESKPGHDLILSIDRRIQYLAYKELLNGVIENQAQSGSVIVLDTKTGEVLAMVNQPSFNPNDRSTRRLDNFKNQAVTDIFEPGSTIKAFSVASALDSGRYQTDTIIDTSPGWMGVGRNLVHDEKNHGKISVARVLQVSSNMGVTKMVLDLPKQQLGSLLHRVGFGEISGIGFPGEQSGVLESTAFWGDFKLATLGFGYGLSVTALQLARAYAVLANDGVKVPISLLRLNIPPQGTRVMEAHVANSMLNLLETVITKGATGEWARVAHYRVAGKTGTAKMVGVNGYEKRYTASFVGIAPLKKPRLVVAVVIHDPQGKKYYGGVVAGPVFSRVMAGALRILNIPPDG